MPLIAVLDYEIGNLRSAQKALEHLGADARLTADAGLIRDADAVVLPGVGAFGRCMEAVRRAGLEPLAHDTVERGVPFLGICIGMQMLFESSEESPGATGLGILPGIVRLVPGDVKRPQMQWNLLDRRGDPELLRLAPDPAWAYFVHSYAADTDDVDRHRHLRLRRSRRGGGGPGRRVGHPVPPREVEPHGPRRPAGLRRARLGPRHALMQLFPAIDLRGGKVVQLIQGDFDRERIHGDDPVAVAQSFVAAGAPWIHTVDLDAARSGEPVNRALIGAIADGVDVPVQAGGGVRSAAAAAALADLGVARVVMGTAAMEDPDLVATIASRQPVALGLDVRGREVAVRGWAEGSGVEWPEALRRLANAGAEAVVVTQIQVEGLMDGADTSGLAEVLAATDLDVIASGGVGTLADLLALDAVHGGGRRLAGAIVGTAIYEGRVDVATAVAALQGNRA